MKSKTKQFLKDTGATTPVICGPMYPGSNPELIAAVSEAGGFGVVQPVALTSLYGHDFREGLKLIKKLTFINDLFSGFFLINTLIIQFKINNVIIIISGVGMSQK